MIFTGSNTQAIIDALSGTTGLLLRLGDAADAENDSTDRAVFLPRSRRHRGADEQPVDPDTGRRIGKAVMTKGYAFDVRVYCGDFDAGDRVCDAIVAGLHDLLGPRNFDMLPPGAQIEDGGVAGRGFMIPMTLVLWAPVLESALTALGGSAAAGTGAFKAGRVDSATTAGNITNQANTAGEAV